MDTHDPLAEPPAVPAADIAADPSPDPAPDPTLAEALEGALTRLVELRQHLQQAEPQPVRLIETHISWILLGETRAWKLKKPLQLPFLDMRSLAARRHSCEEELRLNRRLAPDLYLHTSDVHAGPQGANLDGDGPVVDVAVCMRRFPDGALWREQLVAGTLKPEHIDAMAERLAPFHAAAPQAPADSDWGTPATHARTTQGLIAALDDACARAPLADAAGGWPALRAWLGAQLQPLAPFWDARRRAGQVREVHGDLHLNNVLLVDGQVQAFDGIDFDPALRWIDPLYDLAFLAMDLMAAGRADFAWRLLDAWLARSGDHAGLPGWRFYLVSRALVRARVAALDVDGHAHGDAVGGNGDAAASAAQAAFACYLQLACTLAQAQDARLAITHGLPGSGKSHVAQALLAAVGAVRLRSDVERKRLHGLAALAPSASQVPGGIYQADTNARTYARLGELAEVILRAGWPVVIDAACLRRTERQALAALAARLGCPFTVIDCQAPLALLQTRITQRLARGQDPSEADLAVLERLRGFDEALDAEERAVCIPVGPDTALSAVARQWHAAPLRPH